MSKHSKSHYNLVVLGLDTAGKSQCLMTIKGESGDPPKASWGFSVSSIIFRLQKRWNLLCTGINYTKKIELNFYDVGGHEKFRQIWSNYYADVFGCIYVIDAENIDRIQESKECLFQIAKHDFMVGKPILILINRPGKVSIPWVTEELELNKLTETKFHNSKKHMVCIKEADAKLSADELQAGLEWMVRTIDDNYQNLSLKAHQDVIRQKLKWDAEQREVQLKLQQFNGPKTNKNKVYPIESAI